VQWNRFYVCAHVSRKCENCRKCFARAVFLKISAGSVYVLARPDDMPQFYQKGNTLGNDLGLCALNDNIREMMCFFGLVLKTSSRSAILQRSWSMFLLETKEE
jgi:hypothetical protein